MFFAYLVNEMKYFCFECILLHLLGWIVLYVHTVYNLHIAKVTSNIYWVCVCFFLRCDACFVCVLVYVCVLISIINMSLLGLELEIFDLIHRCGLCITICYLGSTDFLSMNTFVSFCLVLYWIICVAYSIDCKDSS